MDPGRLHVITDETLQSRFSHEELARLAAEAGADVVQFREKRDWETAALVRVARAVRERLAGWPTRLVVNDRADVAAAGHADGVHLGVHDLEPDCARRLLGGRALIGATANDVERARRVTREPVDYLGVGPVFGTRSKREPAADLGLDGLRRIVRAVAQPVVAIGNITPERVAAVLETGAHGVAVLSAVVLDADPGRRVGEFVESIERATGGRSDR
jgi:thiamine-phosphate pyrophosphorylase